MSNNPYNYYTYYKPSVLAIIKTLYVKQTGNTSVPMAFILLLPLNALFFIYQFFSYPSIAVLSFFFLSLIGCILFPILIASRRKKAKAFFYKIPDAHKLFHMIQFNSITIDELTRDNALVFYGDPHPEFLDFLYNAFYHCHVLKQQNINLYTLTMKDLSSKYHLDDSKIVGNKLPPETNIFCIKMCDLVINDENIDNFSFLRKKLRVPYWDDIFKCTNT